ncbi:hypothetical protein ACO0K9_08925 [Undibacterium sp. Ji50W]|uniref:hypothetical protein n=1 Tax=Undibacterium sp. Ji50W TaxID=3413041 RepID=UPI003BF01D51
MKKAEITTSINKSEVDGAQFYACQEHEMRVLTENEVLSVAGGPEVDVEIGGG